MNQSALWRRRGLRQWLGALMGALMGPLLWLACVLPAAASPLLAVQLDATTVAVGGVVGGQVRISDVDDLYAFQFDLRFTPGKVAAGSQAVEGSFLASVGATVFDGGGVDDNLGHVDFIFGSLSGLVTGASVSGIGFGELITFSLTGVDAGSATVSIDNVLLLDSLGNVIDLGALQSATLRITGGGGLLPEPNSGLLVITLLAALVPLRRQRG